MPLSTTIPSLPLLVAEGGGFDVFDPNGAGNFLWTLLIFGLSLPLMWKMVFGPIVSALIERDAKASEAIHAAEAASEAALLDHAAEQLARFQQPKKIIFGNLPKTSTGKIKKNELRARLKALLHGSTDPRGG